MHMFVHKYNTFSTAVFLINGHIYIPEIQTSLHKPKKVFLILQFTVLPVLYIAPLETRQLAQFWYFDPEAAKHSGENLYLN